MVLCKTLKKQQQWWKKNSYLLQPQFQNTWEAAENVNKNNAVISNSFWTCTLYKDNIRNVRNNKLYCFCKYALTLNLMAEKCF